MARLFPLRLSGATSTTRESTRRGFRQRLVEFAWRLNGTRLVNEVPRADLDLLFDSTFL